MILTVEEAKTKWCPYTQETETHCNCIAEGCMAWRWVKKGSRYTRAMPDCPKCHGKGSYDGKFTDIDGTVDDVTYSCDCSRETHKEKVFGYCGLVGNPEGVNGK